MRVFPTPLRGLVLGAGLALVMSSGAHAIDDGQTAAAIQIKLVTERQQLNALYDKVAAASERLNGAIYRAELVKAEVARNKASVAAARKGLNSEKESVAELTVQDLQSSTGISKLSALLDSAGPAQLLERSAAYSSTQEAMTAHIDSLTASTVVFDAAVRRASIAEAKQRKALADQARAKVAIEHDIAAAEATFKKNEADRAVLLAKLAKAQKVSVAAVTKRQDAIDKELDSEPGVPTSGTTDPGPTTPKPTTPKPATPKPTIPKPTTPPKTTSPPPVVSAPPASSNKVETAIAFAKAQLGDPYKWGGTGPNSWDCSGLVMKAWAAAGVSLPHYGGAQYTSTRKVSMSSIQRGDLLFWSNGGAGSIYHVAMYLGGGQMIHAPRTGRDVEIVSFNYWIKPNLASRPG
ncbi:MAG: NlpC/P60 family protein [Aeromicrobium sp.]